MSTRCDQVMWSVENISDYQLLRQTVICPEILASDVK